jgi:isocitrate/isopropylmalate dehydrogenase
MLTCSYPPSTEVSTSRRCLWDKRLTTGKYTVTLVPGDGIGPEITDSVKEIFEGLKVPVEWEQYNVSGETSAGEGLFQEAMDSLRRNKVGLKGESSFPSS